MKLHTLYCKFHVGQKLKCLSTLILKVSQTRLNRITLHKSFPSNEGLNVNFEFDLVNNFDRLLGICEIRCNMNIICINCFSWHPKTFLELRKMKDIMERR